jgi:class 3 adenylate cyclase
VNSNLLLAAPRRDVAGSLGTVRHGAARGLPVYRIERAIATVLFTDIQSSMELSRSVEPEQWWSVIRVLVELMCEGVHRFAGWMGNFTGDGIEAIFQQTGDRPSHAERACRAALWLQDAIQNHTRRLHREQGLDLSVRIGLNSGEILIGTIVDRHNCYYTATGYAVALAKRIEGLAAPGHVYLSEHTARLLGPELALRNQGMFAVKGAPLPIDVFELTGTEEPR